MLDLKQPAGREALLRLMPGTDVLVYNVRPQAMARLGLGYDAVRAVNPKIIYVGAYGYSQRGPYAAKAAYDDLIQGASGIPALSLQQGADAPRYAPVNLADRLTGCTPCTRSPRRCSIVSAAGEGQAVEVPMFESVAHFVLGDHTAGLTFEPPSGEPGYARLLARRPYATQDGYLCVLIYNDKQWSSFFEAIGRPRDDVRSALCHAVEPREQHRRNLRRAVRAHEDAQRPADWMALFEKADIPVARMNSIEDLVADPHLAASGFFEQEDHPTEGTLRTMRTPTSWSQAQPGPRIPPPRLGQHSAEVLREAGYSDAQIAELARSSTYAAG